MSLTAAIDLGTSNVRATLFDRSGAPVGRSQRALRLSCPRPGWVEQDPTEFQRNTETVLAEALTDSGRDAQTVESVGITCQRGTVIAWDSGSGQPLAPAISWQDRRTLDRVREIQALGLPLNTMASCTKFEWLIQNNPDVQAARRAGTLRMGTPDAWLSWCLSGGSAFVTDPSNAGSTALYDSAATNGPAGADWSSDIMEFFNQDIADHPQIVPSAEIVGETPKDLVGSPIAVAARLGDQQAACFGHGITEQGQSKLTLGTSAMFDLCTGVSLLSPPSGAYALPLWRIRSDSPELIESFCLEGSVMSAGSVIEWLVQVGLLPSLDALDKVGATSQVEPQEMINFIPALAGLGTPHMDDTASGSIAGITLATTRGDIVDAAIEGIAQRCTDVIEVIQPPTDECILVDGGLAKSHRLLARIADLSGRVLLPAADHEATVRGVAMMAALACGSTIPPSRHGELVEPTLRSDERIQRRARFAELLPPWPEQVE